MILKIDDRAQHTVEFGLYVTDAERSLEFYRDTLGFEVFGEFALPGRHAWGLRLGNSCIKLVRYEKPIEARNPGGQAIGFRYITVHAVDIPAAEELCRSRGYTIDVPLTQLDEIPGRFGACEVFMVLDPDGNRVEVCDGSPWVLPGEAGSAAESDSASTQ